ncbi:hypothetical protein MLIT_00140 [Mycolicibacterium litorale]|uniref:Uncharacterized protein n=1 Tax=Mycolicibacterium litorale TaxID=758802 RepID=A0AAD1IIT6_9MYCO|nr:hypothetical protein MLIT_00140 [Mycolicibacterium litorale]
MTLLTAGHGRLSGDELAALLRGAGVTSLVDIRRFPGSRAHPDMSRDAMSSWLPAGGIAYRWEERLGGRRRLPPDAPREDPWWQVEQFAAYAAHTRTEEFDAALGEVLGESASRTVLVMCSERVVAVPPPPGRRRRGAAVSRRRQPPHARRQGDTASGGAGCAAARRRIRRLGRLAGAAADPAVDDLDRFVREAPLGVGLRRRVR